MKSLIFLLFCLPLLAQQGQTSLERLEIIGEKTELLKDEKSFKEIDFSQIQQKQATTRSELFSDIPGVSIVNDRPITDNVTIRGLFNRSLEVVDGSRNNFEGGHLNASATDLFFIEKIEIKNSSEASLYGSGSIGGAILYESFNIDRLIKNKDFGGRFSTQSGTNMNQSFSNLVGFRAKNKKFGIGLSHRNFADVLLSDNERMPLSAMTSNSAMVKYDHEFDQLTNSISAHFRQDSSLAPMNPTSNSTKSPAETVRNHYSVRNNLSWLSGNSSGEWHVSTNTTEVEKSQDTSLAKEPREDLRKKTKVQTRVSERHQWSETYSTYHEIDHYKNQVDSSRLGGVKINSYPEGSEQETSLHSRHLVNYDKWHFSLGGRAQNYVVRSTSGQRNNDHIVGEAGVATSITDELAIKAGYSQSYQNPSISKIYPVGLHFPSFAPGIPDNHFLSNPDLKPEIADQYELAVIYDNRATYFRSTYFQTKASDFITQQIDVRSGVTQFLNVDDVAIEGVESEIQYDLNKSKLGAGIHFQWMKDKKTGQGLMDQATNRFNLKWSEKNLFSRNLQSHMALAYHFQQKLVSEGLPAAGGATTFDIGSSYLFLNQWRVNASVHNIFNRKYFLSGSPYPALGRIFSASLQMEY